jgi:hypothetical protein
VGVFWRASCVRSRAAADSGRARPPCRPARGLPHN